MTAFHILIEQHGDEQQMQWRPTTLNEPGAGEVRLRQSAIGVNFIDTYHRSGLYPLTLPSSLGMEACGIVEAVGPEVSELKIGDRVAYAGGAVGAYTTHRIMPESKLVIVPDGIPDDLAAATLLRGMTAQYLLKQTFAVQAGQTILVHAAAGGVGQILCQWAQSLGVKVIGTVGSSKKQALAAQWCDWVLDYSSDDWVAAVRDLTQGLGVPVVYDGVGADTFLPSLDCLAPRGLMASFGNASGPVSSFNLGILAQKGSLYVTRPTLGHYTSTRAALLATAEDYFAALAAGLVKPDIGQRYALQDAAQAHRDLAARQTTGATVLMP
ncbi:quinone oxidoreductase [Chitinibacter bivalviorum]|uniref:Quinone oxidoreductase n=1 Tax=Chitinibacter bivalviorum TaxID=2739434 RepID=A0A7H9BLU5_9NEIS|nr:quinone oxidoreductase [Chitinibacter bivalviorum]QLG89021.1 quinone oxidoreductase [Chitinibacter bivalviorum]